MNRTNQAYGVGFSEGVSTLGESSTSYVTSLTDTGMELVELISGCLMAGLFSLPMDIMGPYFKPYLLLVLVSRVSR